MGCAAMEGHLLCSSVLSVPRPSHPWLLRGSKVVIGTYNLRSSDQHKLGPSKMPYRRVTLSVSFSFFIFWCLLDSQNERTLPPSVMNC